jgi:hypothetical protein
VTPDYTEVEWDAILARECAELEALMAKKAPGTWAFLDRRSRDLGKVTMLVGKKGAFERGMVIYGKDYRSRAESHVLRFNNHHAKEQK